MIEWRLMQLYVALFASEQKIAVSTAAVIKTSCRSSHFTSSTLSQDSMVVDDESNLCLACHWCNFHKGPNLSTIVDRELVPLFHPRLQRWDDHFVNLEDKIIGTTAIGRGTVELFNMNDEDRRELRRLRNPL